MKKIKIHSPGTVANLVCGFDILGMALQEPFDVMELELLEEPVVIMPAKTPLAVTAAPAPAPFTTIGCSV